MPEIDLKQPGFTRSVCGPFNKNKERIKKQKQKNPRRLKIYLSKWIK